MLSLPELQRAVRIAAVALNGMRVNQVHQPDDMSVVLAFSGRTDDLGERPTRYLLFRCKPDYARISLIDSLPTPPGLQKAFIQFLRPRLRKARFSDFHLLGHDRQAILWLDSSGGRWGILLSIMGMRSNIYLLDGSMKVVLALRPLEKTRKELALGEHWIDPSPRPPSEALDRWSHLDDSLYLGEVETTYRRLENENECDITRRKIAQALEKGRESVRRKISNLREDMAAARKSGEYRRLGEILKGVMHTIRPGDNFVEAPDHATGEKVRIAIDPGLTPAENLERYFQRYQRQVRGAAAIEEQLTLAVQEQNRMEDLSQELERRVEDSGGDPAALEVLARDPVVRRLLKRTSRHSRTHAFPAPKATGTARIPSRLLPRRYTSTDGLEIWVGRNDEGNDLLRRRLARGNDLFFHLVGYPGSHVILRTEGRRDPPAESVLDACELAVHFSKLKNAVRADVSVAPVKNLRKPSGVRPGLVYVLRDKTVHLRRDPKRLQRLLESRIED